MDIDQVEYDDPTSTADASAGNKRKLTDSQMEESHDSAATRKSSSRIRPDWIASSVIPPMVQKSAVKIGAPKVKPNLQKSLKCNDKEQQLTIECQNEQKGGF
jgi:hypothetical protein